MMTLASDLLCAVDYLRREYEAPSLLIGHSFGGSAILSIAAKYLRPSLRS
ncbi:lysophospholipase [Serratia plymuthica]|nr:lysophospholipase [Serratia plymuthica]